MQTLSNFDICLACFLAGAVVASIFQAYYAVHLPIKNKLLSIKGLPTSVLKTNNVFRSKHDTSTANFKEEIIKDADAALEDAIFEERNRLKNAIHDFTIQQMVAIKSKLDDVLLLQTNSQASEMIGNLSQELTKTIDSVRFLINNLHLPFFENNSIETIIEELRFNTNRFVRFKVYTKVTRPDNSFMLSSKQKQELYFIVNESLQNSIKYSDGRQFHIWLDWTDGLLITTEDVGFGLRYMKGLGNGIRSMQARAESVGAKFSIEAYKTQGALITIKLPATEARS